MRWFTNLDIKQRHEDLILVKRYDPDYYRRFDNYDAIIVDSVADIPCDYSDVMTQSMSRVAKCIDNGPMEKHNNYLMAA